MSDRLAEIRARLDAATPGTTRGIDDRRPRYNEIAIRTRTGDVIAELPGDGMADALFIAHAPADIAWLLAENEAFREQIQFLRDDLRRVREYAHHRDGCAATADVDAIHDTPCDCGLEVEDA